MAESLVQTPEFHPTSSCQGARPAESALGTHDSVQRRTSWVPGLGSNALDEGRILEFEGPDEFLGGEVAACGAWAPIVSRFEV